MREFRFVLGRRALIVFLALLVATGALLGAPAATRTLAESPPPGSQEVSAASVSADSSAADGPILGPSGHSSFLQAGSSAGAWTALTNSPSARRYHAMATLPGIGVLLFGGDGNSGIFLADTWLYNTTSVTWINLSPSNSPPARYGHAMASLPGGDVLLFGGYDNNKLSDTWLFTYDGTGTGTWTKLTLSSSPSARYGHAMASTPSGALLFGGTDGSGRCNDTWLFTYDSTGTCTWTKLTLTNSPSARDSHAMAATPSGVLLFGGSDGSNLNDTWLFTYDSTGSGTWTKLTLTNSPSARDSHAMAATPSGVLLFGGMFASSYYDDTWLFNTSTDSWNQLSATPPPSARFCHAMAATPSTATPSGVLLFGGGDSPTSRLNDTWLYGPTESTPTIIVTSPTAGAHWQIGVQREITWTSTGLNSTTLTILLARDGVHFTETITHGLTSTVTHYTWTVTGSGAINAKIRVQQEGVPDGVSSGFFTIATAYYPYTGTLTTTLDPVLDISGIVTGTGTLWVTPLTPSLTSIPNLNQFLQETGKRSALFFDIGQEGLTGTLTIVLHFNHRLGEETFVLYRWDKTIGEWVNMPGIAPSPNLANHTFTITINASLLSGTPFGLGGDPAAMPGMSPWALALLSLALLGAGGWWFLRRRRLA